MKIEIVLFLLSLALLYVSFRGFRAFWIDSTRQDLFRYRDSLFDLANQDPRRFQDEWYKVTRSAINNRIRFCHHMSATRVAGVLLTLHFFYRDTYRNLVHEAEPVQKTVSLIADDDLRARVMRIMADADRTRFMGMLFASPLVWVIMVAAMAPCTVLLALWGIEKARAKFVRAFNTFGAILSFQAQERSRCDEAWNTQCPA